MGTTKGKKSLRIGVIQSGRLIEEFIVKQQTPVTVGTNIKNSVVVADRTLPARYKLFTYKNGQYYLDIMPQMKAELKNPSKQEKIEDQKRTISLSTEDKGKISINKTTILFQFIEAPQEYFVPKRIPPQFRNKPKNMVDWRFMGPLVLSIVIHVVWTTWMMSLDLSTQPITMAEIPDRFREAIIEKPKEEPKPVDEKKEGEGDEGEKEAPKKVVKKVVKKNITKEKPTKDVRKAAAKKSIGKKSKTISALRSMRKSGGFGIVNDSAGGDGPASSSLSDLGMDAAGSGGSGSGGGGGTGLPGVRGGGTGGGGGTGISRTAKVTGATGSVKVGGRKRELKTRKVRRVAIKPRARRQGLVMPSDPNITKSNAKKAVRKAMRKAEGCYQREAKKNNSFAGRVVILITIGANGKPISIEIIGAKLNDSSLASSMTKCIKRKLKRVKFPKPAKPPISIRFTAVFSPGG